MNVRGRIICRTTDGREYFSAWEPVTDEQITEFRDFIEKGFKHLNYITVEDAESVLWHLDPQQISAIAMQTHEII